MRARTGTVALGASWAIAVAALAYHGWYAVASEYYVNSTIVAGVWMSLAHDLANGIFYRPLVSDAGYGGTRYFPLFFSVVASLDRMGLSALAAGYLASGLGAVLLALGVLRLLTMLGVRRGVAVTGALLALAPHFVQETVFSIRSDALAAGLVTWGLVGVARFLKSGSPRATLGSALVLTLAFATKPTAIYGLIVATMVLVLSRAWREAVRLFVITAAGVVTVLAIMHVGSDGRWLESFRACALAGGAGLNLVNDMVAIGRGVLRQSHLLAVTLGLAVAAAVVTGRRSWRTVPVVWLAIAAPATLMILASPGTVATNHTIDLFVAAIVVLAATSTLVSEGVLAFTGMSRLLHGGLVALMVFAASQNAARAMRLDFWKVAADVRNERARLDAAVESYTDPVLSEVPQIVVVAGRSPAVIDPFALRIVTMARPQVLADIRARVDARFYRWIVLTEDPLTPHGRAWYTNAHFGWPVVEAILESYRYVETVGGVRVYAPKRD